MLQILRVGKLTAILAMNLLKSIKETGHVSSSPGFSLGSFPVGSAVEGCLLPCKAKEKPDLLSGLLVKVKAREGVGAGEGTPTPCRKVAGRLVASRRATVAGTMQREQLSFALLCWSDRGSVNCFWTESDACHRLKASVTGLLTDSNP